MSANDFATVAVAVAAALAGFSSAIAAALAVRLQRRWGSTDAFLRIAQQFETPEFRKHRTVIYNLERDSFQSWSEEETAAVNAWCAHLDLVAVLIQSRQVGKVAFLNLYGDVVLRTIYQIAPYCNHQITIRGKQFLLPVRLLSGTLVRTWRKRAGGRRYPITIGFPAKPQVRVNPDLFDSDDAVLAFRVDGKFSKRS
ncbi:hypothetical protein [Phytohabitans rumicis]|uniref:hypothetical protein n=1 Tax=Phytohabitans rumicis TaxID=1076125 RepID=UPI00156461E3|nr:hypothetical protein [Phytohabitans rumicis]